MAISCYELSKLKLFSFLILLLFLMSLFQLLLFSTPPNIANVLSILDAILFELDAFLSVVGTNPLFKFNASLSFF